MELIKLVLTKFTEEAINISILVLLITMCALVATWLYYRKKFRELKHEIPASIVKDYLDAIIQNSTSLKSQLFRGGGLEVGEGVPSVMPLNRLPGGAIGISGSGEDVAQKNAEISMLRNMVTEKERMRQELEEKLLQMQELLDTNSSAEEVQILKEEIETLRSELEAAHRKSPSSSSSNGKADAETLKQLQIVTKERDELKERLMEYEIIEEDLANLKRLQQENEQLKKSLEALQGGNATPVAAVVAAAPAIAEAVAEEAPEEETQTQIVAPKDEAITAAPAEPEPEDDLEAAMAAALRGEEPKLEETTSALDEPKPSADENEKSAEELLSEFEKMLD